MKLLELKGSLDIKHKKIGLIKLGFPGVGIFDGEKDKLIWQVSGNVTFKGTANLGQGSKISVGKKGNLTIGNNFNITANSSIVCHDNIKFGDDVLVSWENLFMDTDFHKISYPNQKNRKGIFIGDGVWITCRNTILKGSFIGNNSVLSSGSILNKKIFGNNVLIGGNPPMVLKEGIKWEE